MTSNLPNLPNQRNAPNLSSDEIDDLLYFARTGDTEEFSGLWKELCEKEKKAQGNDVGWDLGDLLEIVRDEESGNGILHMAAGNGHFAFLKQFLSPQTPLTTTTHLQKHIINAQNKSGNTPLHWAAVNGHLECVKLLIEVGADPTVRNAVGRDPIFEAEVCGRGEVVEWVLREGGVGIESGVAGVGGNGGEGDGECEGEGDVDGDVGEGGEEMDIEEVEVQTSKDVSVEGNARKGEEVVASGDMERKLGGLSIEEVDGKGKGKGKEKV